MGRQSGDGIALEVKELFVERSMTTAVLTRRALLALGWVMFCCAVLESAGAATDDLAAVPVRSLDAALIDSMRSGASVIDRCRNLKPVIEQVFDLPAMAALAVGPTWADFTPQQQQETIAAFTRLTVASYARNFHKYDGERFELDSTISVRGAYRIVQVHLLLAHDAPVTLMYRLEELNGGWRIIDVYFDSISQLTTQRADFAAALAAGGPKVLIAHLTKAGDQLLKND
jgi:phospholipid transport system substrate-binding protein